MLFYIIFQIWALGFVSNIHISVVFLHAAVVVQNVFVVSLRFALVIVSTLMQINIFFSCDMVCMSFSAGGFFLLAFYFIVILFTWN